MEDMLKYLYESIPGFTQIIIIYLASVYVLYSIAIYTTSGISSMTKMHWNIQDSEKNIKQSAMTKTIGLLFGNSIGLAILGTYAFLWMLLKNGKYPISSEVVVDVISMMMAYSSVVSLIGCMILFSYWDRFVHKYLVSLDRWTRTILLGAIQTLFSIGFTLLIFWVFKGLLMESCIIASMTASLILVVTIDYVTEYSLQSKEVVCVEVTYRYQEKIHTVWSQYLGEDSNFMNVVTTNCDVKEILRIPLSNIELCVVRGNETNQQQPT